ncbi:MAG: type II toxin-antitoxin system RelE/ParE family toxin [SAR324 cluster bacterium]|nr:type II toxin-antitoxin system RelE/ParE family toxin [SAR324 cluster bacterium]
MDRREPKPVEWVGSSKTDLKAFPAKVHDRVGFALFQAQIGLKHPNARPLTGMGSGVTEVVSRFERDTYRAVYTVRFTEAIYVLHAFQKKSKKKIATPKSELDLVRQRLGVAEQHYKNNYDRKVKR